MELCERLSRLRRRAASRTFGVHKESFDCDTPLCRRPVRKTRTVIQPISHALPQNSPKRKDPPRALAANVLPQYCKMTPALRHVTKISSLSPKEIKGVLKLALEMKARAGVLCRAVEESTRVKFS